MLIFGLNSHACTHTHIHTHSYWLNLAQMSTTSMWKESRLCMQLRDTNMEERYVCVYKCMCISMCIQNMYGVFICAHAYVNMQSIFMYIHLCVCIGIWMCTYVYEYVYARVYVCVMYGSVCLGRTVCVRTKSVVPPVFLAYISPLLYYCISRICLRCLQTYLQGSMEIQVSAFKPASFFCMYTQQRSICRCSVTARHTHTHTCWMAADCFVRISV